MQMGEKVKISLEKTKLSLNKPCILGYCLWKNNGFTKYGKMIKVITFSDATITLITVITIYNSCLGS